MSYDDKRRQYRDARNAIWMAYLQAQAKDASLIFLFFEDLASQAIYFPSARRHFGNTPIRPFPCRNKNDVLMLQAQIGQMGNTRRRTLFFVDRDHDDFIGPVQVNTDEIFYTRFYSVENYLVTSGMFECFLSEKICVDQSMCDIVSLRERFDQMHFSFLELIRPFMIWTICLRKVESR
jgi:hypothetical protein